MMVWGILAIIYGALVIALAIMKPEAVWKMKKIQFFEDKLGVKGTEIFFYVWAGLALLLGVWLLTK